ncbi:MAG TPA: hypothetical protein VFS00_19655 [Polyangiaceae bacterium]|nr:hypothetical protein [Polyangiaceae bacterium]
MSAGSKEPGPGAEHAGDPAPPPVASGQGDPAPPPGPWRAAFALGGAAVAASLAQRFAASYSLAASIGSFTVVYLVAERVGASWSEQRFTSPPARRALARATLFGLVPALAATLIGWALGGLRFRPGAFGLGLAASALREGFEAARHETLFRWLPWSLARSRVPRPWLVGFQTLAGVAPLLTVAKPEAWALGAALGWLGAGLLDQTRSWAAPVAAHAALRIACAVLVPALFEIRWPEGSWSPLEGARGTPALWLTAALGLAAATLWASALRAEGQTAGASARHQHGDGDDEPHEDHPPEHDAPHDGL